MPSRMDYSPKSLLGLPQELRDQILDLVVLAERAAPPPPKHQPSNERRELNDIAYTSGQGGKNVLYDMDTRMCKLGRIKHYPTLLGSRQLHRETQAAIDRLPTKHSYKMDIMVVGACQLWPTWLSLPSNTTRIDTFQTALRTCDMDWYWHNPYKYTGCTGPRPKLLAWCFYDLLERFLQTGPFGRLPSGDYAPVSIQILELDVVTTALSEAEIAEFERDERLADFLRTQEEGRNESVSDFLIDLLKKYIDRVLCMDRDTAEYGEIVFRRIGTIRLLRGGEFQQEWDLATRLNDLFPENTIHPLPDTRPPKFKQLKADLFESREWFGLPVKKQEA